MANNTNPLSYNAYIQQVAAMAVYNTQTVTGVTSFVDAPPTLITPMMLNYAELRIQRDLDLLSAQSSNAYVLISGARVFALPVDDFVIVDTLEIQWLSGSTVVNSQPLIPVSREFIQNCYGGVGNTGTPKYYAMIGDTFGGNQDTNTNILLGPAPNYAYTLRVSGTTRAPSLNKYAVAGLADTAYTYISSYLQDLLLMASMVYISGFQRNFSATADDSPMSMSYEKQYQALRIGAIAEENRRKQLGSAFSGYSTPVSATPTR